MATLNLNSNSNKNDADQDKSKKSILNSITQLFSNKENESDILEGNIYNNSNNQSDKLEGNKYNRYKNLGPSKDRFNISFDPNTSVTTKRAPSRQSTKLSSNKSNEKLDKIDDNLDDLKTRLSNNIESIKETVENNTKNVPAFGFNFKKIFMWIGILMLLSFFGLNIFSLFGNIIAFITNLIRPILTFFGILSIDTTQKTLDVASDGTKGVANISNNIFQSTIDLLNNTSQGGLSFLKNRVNQQDNVDNKDIITSNNDSITDSDNNTKTSDSTMEHGTISTANQDDINKLSNFIDSNFDNVNKFNSNNNKSCRTNCLQKCKNDTDNNENCVKHCDKYCDEILPEPEPTINNSRVQSHKASGKAGFCYIGEENGIRSCVKVSQHDVCMSGKVYSSKETCTNPRLRK